MPAPTNGRSKGAKNSTSLTVVLKLSASALQRFEKNQNTPDIKGQEQPSPTSSTEIPAVRPSSADNGSDDANSTPVTGATPGDTPRRKGVPGPKPGNKRTNGQTEPGARSRGRPGPKKKPKLEEGGDTAKLPAAQRLGPKANTGAINAGLRALDRTGAACRRWERKPLQLRSFTGILWQLPSWRTPGSGKSDTLIDTKVAALESGDSDTKPTLTAPGTDTLNGSSAVPSEKSNSGDGDVTPASHMVEPSSPAIAMAV
ncbi:hypothetical protein PENARI_c019G00255 [Penicillium arizonense]|uniref:INO80 complex subunit Ies4 n=1 Tax=Penicillium arizonense TaxID=1835702 RepID=A0A1F5LAF4_PENAI|nr:hypothetical protein PENARI_c019G00255 [Penicillium arizonense]OGE49980.1 hypothetical protein PENARI_c019G00255 [Penicillium arizonense]